LFEEIAMVALEMDGLDFEMLSEVALAKKITH